VDVIVTDEEGSFIDDLRPEDFILYEDDARQEIIRAQLVDLGKGTVRDFLAGGEATTGHGETGVPVRPSATTVPSLPPTSGFGAMVYVIDASRLGRWERKRFTRGWVSLLEQTEAFSFPRAVYVIDSLGRLRELAPLTNDVERLRRVGQELLGAVYYPDSPAGGEVTSEAVAGRTPEDIPEDRLAGEFSFAEHLQGFQDRSSGAGTLDILTLICNSLAGRQGRSALVWVSPGIRMQANRRGFLQSDRILVRRMEQLQQAANSANVSIYGVDPTLVTQRSSLMGAASGRTGPVDDILSGRLLPDSSRDSLFMAARATGGKAYPFKTDVDGTLREIEHDNARFYLLTYAAPPPDGDGEYHEIKVEVRRPGATVRARRGYVDRSEADRRALVGASALAMPGSVLDLPVVAGAFQTWTENGEPLLHLAVELVPITEALSHGALDVDQALAERSSLQIHLAAVGEERQLIDSAHFSMPWGVLTDEPQDTAARPPVFLHAWSLGFGRFDLHFLVADEITGRLGTAKVKMDVQEPESDWRISEPTLIHAVERGPPQPILGGRATSVQRLRVYLEVFGVDAPAVSGRIFNRGRSLVADNLRSSLTRRAGSLVHRVVLTVPEDLPAGSYMIEIVVSDPVSKDAKTLLLPLEIAPGTK
jgi:VWFA-related protein